MILVIGLGNPGVRYHNTRHNIGFIAIDNLAGHYNCSLISKKKFNSEVAEGHIETKKILLIKPLTYMNLSGNAVASIKSYYDISLENIYVIHDDIDLMVGRVKYKQGGGNAGHNGLKSLDQTIGSNYHRIRVGVGRPMHNEDLADYVISDFARAEHDVLNSSLNKIVTNFHLLLKNKINEFQIAIS